jgi:hypothetical protein
MIYALLLLSRLLAQTTPAVPSVNVGPDDQLVTTTMKLDDTKELTVTRNAAGQPVRAIVRRVDGKRMTCDPYFAWVETTYSCGGGQTCSSAYTAYGHAGGTSRSNACANAKADGCAATGCYPGSYQWCSLVEAVSGVYYDAGGVCGYDLISNCGGITYTGNCAQ